MPRSRPSTCLVPFLEGFATRAAAEDEFATATMLRHGVSEEVARALQSVSLAYRGWGAGASVDRALSDGEVLEFAGRSLEVCFRPGHSATDTVFLDRERRILIGGDHLLARSPRTRCSRGRSTGPAAARA